MNRLPILLLVTLPLAAQQAAQQPTPPASWKALKFPALKEIQIPKIEESTLPNGMKIYLLENHELPAVHSSSAVSRDSRPALSYNFKPPTVRPDTSQYKAVHGL